MGGLELANAKVKVYLVNHTHWDREWYFSDQDSLVLSILQFKDILRELNSHPEVTFTLDGQTSIIKDFLITYPEKYEQLQALVQNGQLKIGPWYTQSDALHVQGESLLRNGMLGIFESQKIGQVMQIGYLPDTFGFNSQLPVILNQLNLKSFIFWRGIDPKITGGYYFTWKSLGGGSEIVAVNMPQGYGTGMLLEATQEYVNHRLDAGVDFILSTSKRALNNILIPTGNDQLSIIHDFSQKVKKINTFGKYDYQVSSYEEFIETLSDELPTYTGEFIEPVFARVHRSCGSSRMDIKLAATKLEDLLIYQVEPMMVIAKHCGIDLGNGILVDAWQKLLESQAHDSMAGSVVDSVANDIVHRLKQGFELGEGIINTITKLISTMLDLSENQVLLFNTLPYAPIPWQKIDILTSQKIVGFIDTHAVLLKQNFIQPRENQILETAKNNQVVTEHGYYQSQYLVKVNVPALGYTVIDYSCQDKNSGNLIPQKITEIHGTNFTIRLQNNQLVFQYENAAPIKDFIYLEDKGNTGDTYDYSPLANDEAYKIHFDTGIVTVCDDIQQFNLTGVANLPKNLTERKNHHADVKFNFTMTLLISNDDMINVIWNFENKIIDHQLTLVIDTGVVSQNSIASVPFGYLKRDNTIPTDWVDKYSEMPLNYFPMDNNVSLYNDDYGMTIFSSDFKEYRQQGSKILLTALATTNQLGKENLITRPGRASGDTSKVGHPKIATPNAELLGLQMRFECTILISKNFNPLVIDICKSQIKGSIINYQAQTKNLFVNRLDNKLQTDVIPRQNLPKMLSCVSIITGVSCSAIYPSYTNNRAMIIRVVNPTDKIIKWTLPKDSRVVNALEETIGYDGVINPYDVLSVLITN